MTEIKLCGAGFYLGMILHACLHLPSRHSFIPMVRPVVERFRIKVCAGWPLTASSIWNQRDLSELSEILQRSKDRPKQ